MKKINLLFIIPLFFPVISQAQAPLSNILPKISPASPEQASFAKFGNYQVNLFTGLPDITIPLYEIKSGDLSLPISISYHASGIKVNDWGSWVGTGWSLSAGASITRKIMGLADEDAANSNGKNYLSGGTVRLKNSINTSSQTDLDYLRDVNHRLIDAEPDIFNYHIAGMSGNFLFDRLDGFKPILIPFNPIKISRTQISTSDINFKVTSENGTNYDFGTEETTYINKENTSAWLLSKMSSANGKDEINFTYSERWGQVGFDYQDFVADDQNVVNDDHNVQDHYISTPTPQPGSTDIGISSKEQKIHEITFPNGKVIFYPSGNDREDGFAGQKALSYIEVQSLDPATGTYTKIKTIHFYQSYFVSGTTNVPWYDKRLRLDRVEITDKNDVVVEKYQFDYNSETTMPDRLSRGRDFWGYYNGKTANNTLVRQQTVPFLGGNTPTHTIGSVVQDSREPVEYFMKACILKRINYPTGGYTDFDFEINRYKDENNAIKNAGGLRIKTIKSYDGINSVPLVKTYKYGELVNNLENGAGRANFFNPLYYSAVAQRYNYLDNFHNADGLPIPGCIAIVSSKDRVTYYATPTIETEPYDGSPVAYSKVTEYIGDGTNNTGKTIYEFTDKADNIYNNAPTQICYRPIVTSYHMERGELSHKWVYKKITGGYQIVAETLNTYNDLHPADPLLAYQNVGMVVFKSLISEGPSSSDISITADETCAFSDNQSYQYENYNIWSTYRRLTETTSITYDENDITKKIATTSTYSYENPAHMQPTKIVTANSKGETISLERKYPPDFATAEPYATMTNLNILDNVVQEKNLKNATQQIGLMKTNYLGQGNTNYLPASVDYQLGTNPLETRAAFNNYDAKGNILDMQKTNNIRASFQWGYNQVYPVAEVINASNDLKETIVTDHQTQSLGLTAGANTTNSTSISKSVTVTYTGDITIKLGNTGTTVETVTGNIIGIGNSNTLISVNFGAGGCEAGFAQTFANITPGTYTITITLNGTHPFGYCGTIYYPGDYTHTTITGTKEFFYNGFEEDNTASTATPCAGKRYKTGDYTVPFTKPTSKIHYVSYHYLEGGIWKAQRQIFQDNMTLTDGDAIDEVRVAPKGAQMVTYTYEPLIGMTSKCDVNNHFIFYNYDTYGRLRMIKDEDGRILKMFTYKYALTNESGGALATCNDAANGNCTGEDNNHNPNKKCINGSCELGRRVNMSTTLKPNGTWKCTYHYEFSDGTSRLPTTNGVEYIEINASPCDL